MIKVKSLHKYWPAATRNDFSPKFIVETKYIIFRYYLQLSSFKY